MGNHAARATRAAGVLLITGVVTACATQPTASDTPKQAKVRSDLEECNTAAGGRAHSITATPEGKYSFQVIGKGNVNTILTCMTGKGYSGQRVDNTQDHGAAEMIRSGGEGAASR
jgi:hypothetical protein